MRRLRFATLFYSNYAAKGIALYRSLERTCPDFHMYIVAMDDACVRILQDLSMPHATIIPLRDVETFYKPLLQIKETRSTGEYCWTCKGPILLYCNHTFHIDDCSYLDSDLYFFSDPTPLYEECPEADVMLMDHRYTNLYNYAETNGKYCAGFIYFRYTTNGLKILNAWTEQCVEWCYGRQEPGRFGDQKYLDEFHNKYSNVYDVQHIGSCAPWNIQQYKVSQDASGIVYVTKNGQKAELILYHFHFLNNHDFGKYNEFYVGPYYLSDGRYRNIYKRYLAELQQFTKYIDDNYPGVDVLASRTYPMSGLGFVWHWCKNFWKRNKIVWRRR